LLAPPTYCAAARIKIERDQTNIPGVAPERPYGGSYDPYFIQTEFEVIQSQVILDKVIRDLDLNKEWGRRFASGETLKTAETMKLLRDRMDLRPVRNTSLIGITVNSDKPEEAAKLANAIARAYKDHRLEQRLAISRGGIESLEERFKKSEKDIEDQQKKVKELREKLNITDSAINVDAPALLLTTESLRRFEAQRLESQAELARQEALLAKLKELSPTDLRTTLPTVVQDQILTTFIEQLNLVEQQLIAAQDEFGPKSNYLSKLNSQIKDLKVKIDDRVKGNIKALEAKVEASRRYCQTLISELQQAVTNDVMKAGESQPYYDARHKLEQMQRFHTALTMKVASEKTDIDMPKSVMTEIIDQAVVPNRLVSPNRYRAAASCALGLLLGLIGSAMVKSAGRKTLAQTD
jgi:uncharacterized protein involved in exopolysaccharide biosynthesis